MPGFLFLWFTQLRSTVDNVAAKCQNNMISCDDCWYHYSCVNLQNMISCDDCWYHYSWICKISVSTGNWYVCHAFIDSMTRLCYVSIHFTFIVLHYRCIVSRTQTGEELWYEADWILFTCVELWSRDSLQMTSCYYIGKVQQNLKFGALWGEG